MPCEFQTFEWDDIDAFAPALLSVTRYGKVRIPIYVVADHQLRTAGCHAFTDWRHGRMIIVLRVGLLADPKRCRRTLRHEFAHVVEYLNDASYLDPTIKDNCTKNARTQEVAQSEIVENMRWEPRAWRKLRRL